MYSIHTSMNRKYPLHPYRDVQYDCEDWSDAHSGKYDPTLLHAILVLAKSMETIENQDEMTENVARFGKFLEWYRNGETKIIESDIDDINQDTLGNSKEKEFGHPFFSKLHQYMSKSIEYIPELDQRGNHLASESIERHMIAVHVFESFPNCTMDEYCEALKIRDSKLFTNYRIQKIKDTKV
jgi:hypothetical protein